MLDYERLDVYKKAIEFFSIAIKIMDKLPKGYSSLNDQFKRASLSIGLNIAEGSGKIKVFDRRRYYSIARGSAMESGAILD